MVKQSLFFSGACKQWKFLKFPINLNYLKPLGKEIVQRFNFHPNYADVTKLTLMFGAVVDMYHKNHKPFLIKYLGKSNLRQRLFLIIKDIFSYRWHWSRKDLPPSWEQSESGQQLHLVLRHWIFIWLEWLSKALQSRRMDKSQDIRVRYRARSVPILDSEHERRGMWFVASIYSW